MKGLWKVSILSPPLLVLLGAFIAAIGAFWASSERAKFESTIEEKSREIADLSQQSLDAITGGDSFCFLWVVRPPGSNLPVLAILVHEGDHPIYDVTARVVDLDRRHAQDGGLANLLQTETTLEVGTLSPGTVRPVSLPGTSLPQRGYDIYFEARNGAFTELLRFAEVEDSPNVKVAIRVSRGGTIIHEHIEAGFPDEALRW